MAIPYYVAENTLKNGSKYVGRTSWHGVHNREALIDIMIRLGASGTPAEIKALLEFEDRAIVTELMDGFHVDDGRTVYGTSIGGGFSRPDEAFNHNVHELRITTNPNATFRLALRGYDQLERIAKDSPNQAPHLNLYFDYAAGVENSVVTPNQPARLEGERLQFDAQDLNQGIFFVGSDASAAYRATMVMEGGARRIMFMTPADMPPGRYYLTVRTKVDEYGNRLVGELRFLLTVPDPAEPETAAAADRDAESQPIASGPLAV
jgi:hypothetical protein